MVAGMFAAELTSLARAPRAGIPAQAYGTISIVGGASIYPFVQNVLLGIRAAWNAMPRSAFVHESWEREAALLA